MLTRLAIILIFGLFVAASQAQDATATPETRNIECDNTGSHCTIDGVVNVQFKNPLGSCSAAFNSLSGAVKFDGVTPWIFTSSCGDNIAADWPDQRFITPAPTQVDESIPVGTQAPGQSQRIEVNSDTPGLNAKRVGAGGVGLQDIVDRGVIEAVNLWGNEEAETEVCIQGSGTVLFKDTSTTQHQVSDADSYQRDGKTCTQVSGSGTVILVEDDDDTQSGGSGQSQPAAQATPGATPTPSSPQWISEGNCCYHPDWNCAASDNKAWERGYFTVRQDASCPVSGS